VCGVGGGGRVSGTEAATRGVKADTDEHGAGQASASASASAAASAVEAEQGAGEAAEAVRQSTLLRYERLWQVRLGILSLSSKG